VANIVDQFVTNPQEKQEALKALREYELDLQKQALEADRQQLEDRASARQMAGIHGKLQTTFAITFLIGFLVMLVGQFVFIGFLIAWTLDGTAAIPDWLQVLISSTLAGVIGYMVSMLKEVVGFLFGGSAGGDDAMMEAFSNARSRQDGT
jgi:hypothetical protein